MDMPTTKIQAKDVKKGMVLIVSIGAKKHPHEVLKVEKEGARRRIFFDYNVFFFVDGTTEFDRTVGDATEPFNWKSFEQSKDFSNRARFSALMDDIRYNEMAVIKPIAILGCADDQIIMRHRMAQRAFDLLKEAGIINE